MSGWKQIYKHMTKYSLEEIRQMLEEPSFNGVAHNKSQVDLAFEILSDAIAHHEMLDKADDGEGF